ncbi:hypothetical protein S7711_11564 [Stachybotrys chartarum IBT 7711]|uniref:Uncharacterized protein n=1 Tax=Stachybotrys chartarum (strain CBS 109288 / IBT 7711) TaxID=1280523 RepID=A0A084B9X0_STACB|nr:hypothetical protein S7711_11564 [Stachybotrys chartarum IBT 7711]
MEISKITLRCEGRISVQHAQPAKAQNTDSTTTA